MNILTKLIVATAMLFVGLSVFAQGNVGVKTNLLYGAGTLTPNLGVEIGLGKRTTLDVNVGYNWFNLNGTTENNKKLVHWLVRPEFRYWLCEKFNGHFLGVHALGSQFNISGHNLSLLLEKDSKQYRYQGWAIGAGISYGYQLFLSKRWNAEFSLGVGYAYLDYNKYPCYKCGDKLNSGNKHYLGPTNASVSLIYILK